MCRKKVSYTVACLNPLAHYSIMIAHIASTGSATPNDSYMRRLRALMVRTASVGCAPSASSPLLRAAAASRLICAAF